MESMPVASRMRESGSGVLASVAVAVIVPNSAGSAPCSAIVNSEFRNWSLGILPPEKVRMYPFERFCVEQEVKNV